MEDKSDENCDRASSKKFRQLCTLTFHYKKN